MRLTLPNGSVIEGTMEEIEAYQKKHKYRRTKAEIARANEAKVLSEQLPEEVPPMQVKEGDALPTEEDINLKRRAIQAANTPDRNVSPVALPGTATALDPSRFEIQIDPNDPKHIIAKPKPITAGRCDRCHMFLPNHPLYSPKDGCKCPDKQPPKTQTGTMPGGKRYSATVGDIEYGAAGSGADEEAMMF